MFSTFLDLLEGFAAFASLSSFRAGLFAASAGSYISRPLITSVFTVSPSFREGARLIQPRPGLLGRRLRFLDDADKRQPVNVGRPVLHGRDFHAFGDVPDSQNDQAVFFQCDRGVLASDYLNGNRGRTLVFEMQGQIVAFLFRAIPGETGVAGDIVQRSADCILADGYVFLQISYGLAEQVRPCRYVCINRQGY